jgi:hypothetical protein
MRISAQVHSQRKEVAMMQNKPIHLLVLVLLSVWIAVGSLQAQNANALLAGVVDVRAYGATCWAGYSDPLTIGRQSRSPGRCVSAALCGKKRL